MNEQANKVLAELLQKAVSGIDQAVAFSQAQVPDVIHQLLVWNAVSSALIQILGVLLIVGPIVFCVKKWEWIYRNDLEVVAPVSLFPISIGGFLIAFNFDWLQIWLAPKLYLLEYAVHVIK